MTSARIRLLTVPRDRLWQDGRMSHRTPKADKRQAGKGLGSVREQNRSDLPEILTEGQSLQILSIVSKASRRDQFKSLKKPLQ